MVKSNAIVKILSAVLRSVFMLSACILFSACAGVNNSNPDIESLVVSTGTLSPSFDRSVTSYTLKVSLETTSFTVTPVAVARFAVAMRATLSTAVVAVELKSNEESTPFTVEPGTSTLTINCKSPDKKVEKNYVITIIRGLSVEESVITGNDTGNSDNFGTSIAISEDTLVVGAPQGAGTGNGIAYVFTRSGSTWVQEAKLTASDGTDDDRFGCSVGIYGDTIVVGAMREDTTQLQSGAAYVYTRSGTTWTERQKLKNPTPGATYYFGTSVGIYGDVIVVGEPNYLTGYWGAAHVFTGSGASWVYTTILTASDTAGNDSFGASVAIYNGTIVVGAEGKLFNVGAVYVYTTATGSWSERAILYAVEGAAVNSYFGQSVSISGNLIVVGAYGESTTASGSGGLYAFIGSDSLWIPDSGVIKAEDPEVGDSLGWSVVVQGNFIAAGAINKDSNRGAVYLFMKNTSGVWTDSGGPTYISGAAVGDYFGYSIAIYGEEVVSGAYREIETTPDSGAVHTFY
ncbi:MAG: cadherin-like beta sandwich domain-containing protein [Pseudomonadota bacterium]